MIDRFQPVDWYDDRRRTPKLYRDMDTGEEITLHEYRKRRRAALSEDEASEEEQGQEEELETQAYAEPAPRPRLFSVPQATDDKPPTARRMGIAEMLAPAVAGFATSVALIRLRDRPTQVFVPPKEVTDPLLRPVGRIIDRHLPMDIALLIGEDGKDVAAFIVASGAALTWFQDAVRSYEGYKANEQQQYAERRGAGSAGYPIGGSAGYPAGATAGTAGPSNGAVPYTPSNTAYDWPGDILRRVGAGNGGQSANGVRPDGASDAPAVNNVSDADAVARLRGLFSADAEGRIRRGLDAGQ